MNGSGTRGMGCGGRLIVALVLVLAGAAAAVWTLAHYQSAAQTLGVVPPPPQPVVAAPTPAVAPQPPAASARGGTARIAALEQRLSGVENATERDAGLAGRADARVVAFAARRAIDRGVALGYLENLLVDRLGAQHPAAAATSITSARRAV